MTKFKLLWYLLSTFIAIFGLFLELNDSTDYFASILLILSFLLGSILIVNSKANFGNILLIALVTKICIFPFLVKSIYLEGVSSFLLNSEHTANLVFVTTIICFASVAIQNRFLFSKNRLIHFNFVSKSYPLIFVFLGLLFLFLHNLFAPVLLDGNDEGGFGGFGSLVSIGYLGIIIHLYNVKRDGNDYFKLDLFILITLACYLLMSLISNTKQEFISALLSVFFSIIFFKIKIKKIHILSGLLTGLIFIFLVSPIIHETRTLEYRVGNIDTKVEILTNVFSDNNSTRDNIESTRTSYFPINGHLFDRLDILEESDLIVNGITQFGYVGFYPLSDGFVNAMPSFIVSNKSNAAVTDKIMWDIREKPIGLISRTTIGVAASLYSVGGVFAIILCLPFITIVFPAIISFFVGGTLFNQVLPVFFLVKYLLFYTEKSFEGLIILLVRDLPVTLIQIYFVVILVNLFITKRSNEKGVS